MAERTTLPLLQALRIESAPKLALVGAGGKTTLLFKLAAEFTGPVLITTTTHFGRWQLTHVDQRLMLDLALGWAAVVSLPFAIMSEKVDKSRMGFFMGIFNLSVVLPQLVASFAMGRIISHAADKSVVFVISGISLAISAFLWLFVSEKKKSL